VRGALCQSFVFFGYAQQRLLLARIIFKDVDGRIRPDQEWKLEVNHQLTESPHQRVNMIGESRQAT
jgi:hypothetical protein